MGTNMEIHQIIQTGQAGSSLHSVTDLERLKMQKIGLEKAMRHLGVLGMSIDDLRSRDSLGSQLECDGQRVVLGKDAPGACPVPSHAFSSLSPLLSSVSLRKVEPMICWWVTWRPSQALEVKHVQPLVQFSAVTQLRPTLYGPRNRSTPGCTLHCRSQSLCQAQGAGVCPTKQRKILRQRRLGHGDLGRGLGSLERWEEKPSSSLDSLAEVLAVAPAVNVFTADFLSPGSLLRVNIHFFPFSSFFLASFKLKVLILNTIDSWSQVILGLQGLCCPCRLFNSIPGLYYLPDIHSTPTAL